WSARLLRLPRLHPKRPGFRRGRRGLCLWGHRRRTRVHHRLVRAADRPTLRLLLRKIEMPKTLTKMQEQLVAKVLTLSAVDYVHCRAGEVNSVNNLRDRGLLKGDCWGAVQH